MLAKSVTREVALATIKRPPVYRVPGIQLVVLLVVSAGLGVVDVTIAWSVLAGGVVAIIPHLYFTVYAFRHMGARVSPDIARSFARGEAGKFILTMVGFACVFKSGFALNPLAVFGGYFAMLIIQWWAVAVAVRGQ
ncbi:hypothetical protein GCM10027217_36720 [Pseudomaricurvus hydrocarbonicus]